MSQAAGAGQGPAWTRMNSLPRTPVAAVDFVSLPTTPGVYVFYRDGEPIYVGVAAGIGGLRRRLQREHLDRRRDLSRSAFRRNVAELLGVATIAHAKLRPAVMTDEQVGAMNAWVAGCEVVWTVASTKERARLLESELKVAAGALRAAAAAAAPNETGGVLIGRSIGGVPVVTTVVELPASKATPAGFQVESGVTSPVVEAAVEEDPTVGYVGEWHSHPSDQPASRSDRTTMLRLASAQGTGDPVLMVLRPRGGGYELDAYVATGSDLHRVQVVTVGDITPPDLAER